MTGLHLAQYRIDAELGRGGMGVVYRATDTKLNRTVAVKVLPASALASADDRARFFREAQAAAQLHHPHIATVFQIDEAVPVDSDGNEVGAVDGVRPFIAMEFVSGETLQDRIKQGPVKLTDAVSIVGQVADALKAAHAKGIVHRDIKSANVMLTESGVAKVLDFGLAKTNQSTMLTRMGSTLGTVAYMSPEQARGEEVDGRTDLWALGIVLYEMIAGRLPFAADYEQAALYGILNEDPEPLTAVRTGVPMELEAVVFKLLRKEARLRYQTAGDLMADLEAVQVGSRAGVSTSSRSAIRPASESRTEAADSGRRWRRYATWFGLGGLLLGVLITAVLMRITATVPVAVTPKVLTQVMPARGSVLNMSISPDGSKVAYASGALFILDLSTGTVTTREDLNDLVTVEFSSDGRELLLARSQGIVRVPVSGGTALPVVQTYEGGPRASWGGDGFVYYEERNGVYRVSVTGGEPQPVVGHDSSRFEVDIDWPSLIPGTDVVVATVERTERPDQIVFAAADGSGRVGMLDVPGRRVRWSDSGHLIFVMNTVAVAMPFDRNTLQQTGPTISLADQVSEEGLSFSSEGTLIHGGPMVGFATVNEIMRPLLVGVGTQEVWPLDLPDDRYVGIRLSPDGLRAVASIVGDDPGRSDIWLIDLERSTRRRLTEDGYNIGPTWMPDGQRILYTTTARIGVDFELMIMDADGSNRRGLRRANSGPGVYDADISPDEEWITYAGAVPTVEDQASNLFVERLSDQSLLADFRNRFDNPRHPAFSPDGRFIAFDEAGAIRLLSLERPETVPQVVSESGMRLPRWDDSGRYLYASGPDGVPYRIPVSLEPTFSVTGQPQMVANWPVVGSDIFDVSSDGKWIVLPATPGTELAPDMAATQAQSSDLTIFVNYPAIIARTGR